MMFELHNGDCLDVMAAMLEGFNFVGIELEEDYMEIARRRIGHAARQPRQPSLFEAQP